MYGTIYHVKKNLEQKDPDAYSFTACFSGHYASIQQYKILDIFVLDTYNIKEYAVFQAYMKFNDEDIQSYSKYLQKMGFKFELIRTKINIKCNNNKIFNNVDAWKFHINIKDNSNISNLILMNTIRYLYEKDNISIAKDFLLLAKSHVKELLFNKFCISHARRWYASNHSLNNPGSRLMGLYTKKEFEDEIINNKQKVYTTGSIRKLIQSMCQNDTTLLRETFKTDNPKKIIEIFKTIYDKIK